MKIWKTVIIALLLISLIAVCNAQTASYAGEKTVLQILSVNGSQYNVKVLSTYDPNLTVGGSYTLKIIQLSTKSWCAWPVTPAQLVSGVIIGINDYGVSDNTITVSVSANGDSSSAWEQKITILGTSNTGTTNGLQNSIGSSTPSLFATPFQSNSMINLPSETFNGLPSSTQDSLFPIADQFTQTGTMPDVPSGHSGSVPGYYLAYGYPSVSTPQFPFNSPMLENPSNFAF